MASTAPISQHDLKLPAVCPTNGQRGRRVDALTLRALLNRSLTEVFETKYWFCPYPECPTVYYSQDGTQVFDETAVRERVYQKHAQDSAVLVCYCFQHTLGEIAADGQRLTAEISEGVKNGQCACEIRNPQGSCCLGNVNQIVKRAEDARII